MRSCAAVLPSPVVPSPRAPFSFLLLRESTRRRQHFQFWLLFLPDLCFLSHEQGRSAGAAAPVDPPLTRGPGSTLGAHAEVDGSGRGPAQLSRPSRSRRGTGLQRSLRTSPNQIKANKRFRSSPRLAENQVLTVSRRTNRLSRYSTGAKGKKEKVKIY